MTFSGKELQRESLSNYFSLDEIIASSEKVPCRFDVDLRKLGYLNPASDNEDLSSGTKLDMPLWLASECAHRQLLAVDLPKHYKEKYREILSADANVVDLHRLCPYFYTFGSQLLSFEHPQSSDVSKCLISTFQNRLRKILDSSQNTYKSDVSSLTEKLDQTERRIFDCGQQSLCELMSWERGETDQITASTSILNQRKRKRAQMEQT